LKRIILKRIYLKKYKTHQSNLIKPSKTAAYRVQYQKRCHE